MLELVGANNCDEGAGFAADTSQQVELCGCVCTLSVGPCIVGQHACCEPLTLRAQQADSAAAGQASRATSTVTATTLLEELTILLVLCYSRTAHNSSDVCHNFR